ncbi:transposase family protein [Limnoglobus roseus]|nr:transposase family protein [Limnoglobus roseus]QEL19365.1 ISAs1 family transposase [Limnoglobus roseus]
MPQQDVSITRHFADRPDPRVDRTKKPSPGDILVVARCAVIAGADSWEEVEAIGQAKADGLKT